MLAKLLIVGICIVAGIAVLLCGDVMMAHLSKDNKLDGPTGERIVKWLVSTLVILAIATILALR